MTAAVAGLGELAARMRQAASDLLDSLTPAQRHRVVATFDPAELLQWTYLPGDRPGLRVRELSTEQRGLASALLLSCCSPRGAADAERVLGTEAIRDGQPVAAEASSVLAAYSDPQYWLRLLGDPRQRDAPWSWRLSGHHLVAQAVVAGDLVSTTPQFFGTQPARVLAGPHAGFRGLPVEEDLARQLVHVLDGDQRRRAVVAPRAPADISSRDDPVASLAGVPSGLSYADMSPVSRPLLENLIQQYVGRAPAPVANRAWADIRQAGLGEVTFSWAGGLEPGQGHYYAVSGRTVLLEYDNTQDGANHVHSVWRDLRHDWAGDLLRSHYRGRPHLLPAALTDG